MSANGMGEAGPNDPPVGDIDDVGRLAALASYDILDTPPEQGFDDVVELARQLCAVPVALVSLVAADRQWFKARSGFPLGETDLNASVCAHALAEPDLLVIPDLTRDDRTSRNPLVTGEPHIRFYAGAPLRTGSGMVLGTLCAIDTLPRPEGLTTSEADGLRRLARQVVSLLELRKALRQREDALTRQETLVQQHTALLYTQQAVTRAAGDVDAICKALVVGAMTALPRTEGGVVELRDGDELVYRAPQGAIGDRAGLRVPLHDSLAGRSALSGKPMHIADVRNVPDVAQSLLASLGVRSCLLVPVIRFDEVVGVLKLQSSQPDAIADDDLQVARLFAGEAATGLAGIGEARALRAARDSENRYRSVFDSIIDFAIIVTDRDGKVTEWNTGAEKLLGWAAEDMLGESVERFFTPEDRAVGRVAAEMRLSLEHGRASDERWHLRRDGSRFWASGELMPVRDEDGTHRGYVKALRDRTAEHLSGKALEEAEVQLRRAQEAGGVGLFTVDVSDDMLTPTPEFCRLYGLPVRDRYPARTFEDLIVPEEAHLVSNAQSRARGDLIPDVEYRIKRADTGASRWIARTGEIERDAAGRVVRFSGVARDVTDRHLASSALARSESRYRALFEAIDDGFCIIEFIDGPHGPSSDYIHVEANPGYERHTGIPGIVGKSLREIAPAEADGWAELYGSVLSTGRAIRFEREFVAAGRHIEVSAARIEPASRRQVSVLFRDITTRKQAENALRASEARGRENAERVQLALSAGAIIGTWHWDLPTDRFSVDEGFARAFGLDPNLGREGLSLEQVVDTVHPDDKAELAAAIDRAIAWGGAYAHQYRVRRASGQYHWIEANGRVDHGADGTPLSFPGVLIDVEDRRAIAAERDRATTALRALNETLEQRVAERTAELMRAEEQLRQAQKMEAVGQLTGGLAHDFNNLLTGISGSLDLLQKRVSQGRINDLDRYIIAAQGASKRAAALTHRLLAFSRRQTLDPKPTDVNRLVHGMAELIRRTVGPAIVVETVDMVGLWTTLVDPSQLENALLNLCINARDAMPDGGRITIETANRWMDDRAAHERDLPPGQYLSLCVSDTGIGMPPDVVARAFDPFFTTKPLGQGTGLGLSMIYGFAKQSGGQVRIYSETGLGTMVCIYLPRHYGPEEAGEEPLSEAVTARAEDGETVLVVDDEATIRMLVGDVLADLGYAGLEAEDGPSGLKILQSPARVDLLVTDVGLPGGMNGRQVADAARALRPDLKVLFITGYAENAAVGNGHLEPGMAVMTKPFAMDDLAAKIRTLIES